MVDKNWWGRWGKDDQRGALNLITPERTLEAARHIRTGQVVELGTEVGRHGPIMPTRNQTWHVTTTSNDHADPGRGRSEDMLMMHTHAHTHLEGLNHVWYDDKLYNGFPADSVGRAGAKYCDIRNASKIAGRGVLLDVTMEGTRQWGKGDDITAADLQLAADRLGGPLAPGDILLIHTGWLAHWHSGNHELFHGGEPGPGPDGIDWLVEQQPSVVGMDNWGLEPLPPKKDRPILLVHERLQRDYGIHIIMYANLQPLVECGATFFFFAMGGLQIKRGVSSPVNPLAIL